MITAMPQPRQASRRVMLPDWPLLRFSALIRWPLLITLSLAFINIDSLSAGFTPLRQRHDTLLDIEGFD